MRRAKTISELDSVTFYAMAYTLLYLSMPLTALAHALYDKDRVSSVKEILKLVTL